MNQILHQNGVFSLIRLLKSGSRPLIRSITSVNTYLGFKSLEEDLDDDYIDKIPDEGTILDRKTKFWMNELCVFKGVITKDGRNKCLIENGEGKSLKVPFYPLECFISLPLPKPYKFENFDLFYLQRESEKLVQELYAYSPYIYNTMNNLSSFNASQVCRKCPKKWFKNYEELICLIAINRVLTYSPSFFQCLSSSLISPSIYKCHRKEDVPLYKLSYINYMNTILSTFNLQVTPQLCQEFLKEYSIHSETFYNERKNYYSSIYTCLRILSQCTPNEIETNSSLYLVNKIILQSLFPNQLFTNAAASTLLRSLQIIPPYVSTEIFYSTHPGFIPHSPAVISQIESIKPSLDSLYDKSLRRNIYIEALAIDSQDTIEIDDAISVYNNSILIHIADPSLYIQPNSPADIEAQIRGATLFMPNQVHYLFPESLSAISSLSKDTISVPAGFTIQVDLNEDGSIYKYQLYTSLLYNVERMTYEEANQILGNTISQQPINEGIKDSLNSIENTQLTAVSDSEQYLYSQNFQKLFSNKEKNTIPESTKKSCDIPKNTWCSPPISNSIKNNLLNTLYTYALRRKIYREERGAIDYNIPNLDIKTTGDAITGTIGKENTYSKAQLVVKEMMILAGEVAGKFGKEHNIPLPYRFQDFNTRLAPNDIRFMKISP
ncbi:hypothetical protein WA158_000340 [Blastocystis sp. Blastoise]